MVSDRAFIFHIYIYCIPWGKTLLVPKSGSSVKVKFQGHSFLLKKKKKRAIAEAFMFHKHIFRVQKISELLLVLVPFCLHLTVGQRRITLALTNSFLVRTSGFFGLGSCSKCRGPMTCILPFTID